MLGLSRFRRFIWAPLYLKNSALPRAFTTGLPPVALGVHPLTANSPPKDLEAARAWIEDFRSFALRREDVSLSFSRSSGPGGQNVNKVNTKATITCPLRVRWVPEWTKDSLRKSSAYVRSSDSLQITSVQYRSQSENVEDCLHKLHHLIHSTALSVIPRPTSEQQKQKVVELQKSEKARRRADKTHRSSIKKSRSNNNKCFD